MLGDSLPGHVKVLAELIQSLPVAVVELIEQGAAAWVSQRFKDVVHVVESQYATKWLHILPTKQIRRLRATRLGRSANETTGLRSGLLQIERSGTEIDYTVVPV